MRESVLILNSLFEIVEDVGGPEKISLQRLEIIPLEERALLPAPVMTPKLKEFDFWYEVTYSDIRCQAKKREANLGLKHAQSIIKEGRSAPKEWGRFWLLFPGTTLRPMGESELHIPVVRGVGGDLLLFACLLHKKKWDLQTDRFVRWKT